MLVLVTMFISVSSSLPKTSYIKMIDYWLIFTLMLPFVEVLLHTYMESLNDDEDRTINHHGVAMDVGEKSDNTVNYLYANTSLTEYHTHAEPYSCCSLS